MEGWKWEKYFLWEDSWLRDKPLANYDNLRRVARWGISKQGEKKINY